MIDVLRGTREAEWRAWSALGALPAPDWPEDAPMIVVAPHPDDEILALGGTLQLAAAAGHPLSFIAVTDGEASHPDSTAVTPEALRVLRREEARLARSRLGIASPPVRHLGLADGAVAAGHDRLVDAILSVTGRSTVVLAPWRADGHPDHEAAGRAAAEAVRQAGASLVEYPVWTWNWARPGDERVPWHRARATHLPAAVRRAKISAIGAFRSQITALGPDPADGPVLPSAELAHHRRGFEVVFA